MRPFGYEQSMTSDSNLAPRGRLASIRIANHVLRYTLALFAIIRKICDALMMHYRNCNESQLSLIDRQGMPRFLRSPCTDPSQGEEQFILGMSKFGIP